MNYTEIKVKRDISQITELTGLDVQTVEEKWMDLCDKGLGDWERFEALANLAQKTSYGFLELVDIYCQEVEDSGDFFDWHYFQWVTVSEDW